MATQEKIYNGPGVGDLIDALKYAYDHRHPHTVHFQIGKGPDGPKLDTVITCLRYDDRVSRTGQFEFEGYINGEPVTGFYDAGHRAGTIRFQYEL
jgi:hypothetical protein